VRRVIGMSSGMYCVVCVTADVNCMICVGIAAGNEGAKEKDPSLPREKQDKHVHQHDDVCLAWSAVDHSSYLPWQSSVAS